jgi:hypothetical protein
MIPPQRPPDPHMLSPRPADPPMASPARELHTPLWVCGTTVQARTPFYGLKWSPLWKSPKLPDVTRRGRAGPLPPVPCNDTPTLAPTQLCQQGGSAEHLRPTPFLTPPGRVHGVHSWGPSSPPGSRGTGRECRHPSGRAPAGTQHSCSGAQSARCPAQRSSPSAGKSGVSPVVKSRSSVGPMDDSPPGLSMRHLSGKLHAEAAPPMQAARHMPPLLVAALLCGHWWSCHLAPLTAAQRPPPSSPPPRRRGPARAMARGVGWGGQEPGSYSCRRLQPFSRCPTQMPDIRLPDTRAPT